METIAFYRDRMDGSHPISDFEVRRREPNTLFGTPLAPEDWDTLGVDPVYVTERPEHDASTHSVREGEIALVDGQWRQTWFVEQLPLPSEPQPQTLGRLQFIVLCQTAGGMTDAMLVNAQKNPTFEAFWIKFQMASAVERDDPITRGALDALAGGGYLPEGKAAVVEAWPKG